MGSETMKMHDIFIISDDISPFLDIFFVPLPQNYNNEIISL